MRSLPVTCLQARAPATLRVQPVAQPVGGNRHGAAAAFCIVSGGTGSNEFGAKSGDQEGLVRLAGPVSLLLVLALCMSVSAAQRIHASDHPENCSPPFVSNFPLASFRCYDH